MLGVASVLEAQSCQRYLRCQCVRALPKCDTHGAFFARGFYSHIRKSKSGGGMIHLQGGVALECLLPNGGFGSNQSRRSKACGTRLPRVPLSSSQESTSCCSFFSGERHRPGCTTRWMVLSSTSGRLRRTDVRFGLVLFACLDFDFFGTVHKTENVPPEQYARPREFMASKHVRVLAQQTRFFFH